MSKVDWSLAPEGTTHFGPAKHSFVEAWFKINGDSQEYICLDSDMDWGIYTGGIPYARRVMLIERPKQPKAWSGPEDGLPPVGMKIEYKIEPSDQWHKGEIRYHMRTSWADCRAIVWNDSLAFDQIAGDNWKFRKLKTPEQLAAELRESAIRELMDIAQVDCRVTAARLVDAGFKREAV